jgi:hypothetical protein
MRLLGDTTEPRSRTPAGIDQSPWFLGEIGGRPLGQVGFSIRAPKEK